MKARILSDSEREAMITAECRLMTDDARRGDVETTLRRFRRVKRLINGRSQAQIERMERARRLR